MKCHTYHLGHVSRGIPLTHEGAGTFAPVGMTAQVPVDAGRRPRIFSTQTGDRVFEASVEILDDRTVRLVETVPGSNIRALILVNDAQYPHGSFDVFPWKDSDVPRLNSLHREPVGTTVNGVTTLAVGYAGVSIADHRPSLLIAMAPDSVITVVRRGVSGAGQTTIRWNGDTLAWGPPRTPSETVPDERQVVATW